MAAALGPLIGDPLVIGDAVAMLRRYSLVTPAGDGMVLVHRLVQAVTLDQMAAHESERYQKAAAALIAAAIPPDASLPKTWPVFEVLYPHAQALFGADSDALIAIATYLGKSGQYKAARDQLQKIVTARIARFGHDDRKTLAAIRRLAYWTGVAGDSAHAWDLSQDLEQACERVLGAEDAEPLAARLEVAAWNPHPGRGYAAQIIPTPWRPATSKPTASGSPNVLGEHGTCMRNSWLPIGECMELNTRSR